MNRLLVGSIVAIGMSIAIILSLDREIIEETRFIWRLNILYERLRLNVPIDKGILFGITVCCCGYLMLRRDVLRKNGQVLVSFVITIILITTLGSAGGLNNIDNTMHLGIPIIGIVLSVRYPWVEWSKLALEGKAFIFSVSIVFATFCVAAGYTNTYRDSTNRFSMRYQIDHPKIRSIFTTKHRMSVIRELLEISPRYFQRFDYTLIDDMPLAYYLTDTLPYLSDPWPANIFDPTQREKSFELARVVNRERPAILVTKTEVSVLESTISSTSKENPALVRKIGGSYTRVWSGNWFEIWLPEQVHK